MPSNSISRPLSLRRVAGLLVAAILTVLATAVISEMPKFEVLDAAIDDDNFTDLIQQTRGDLPIDTNIRVVTFDDAILDSFDLVDRATLAMQLAALMELKPRVVGVDFLIETERPESPDGDDMLAALIAAHPNLIFGIFYEDSLRRFRVPPPRFNIRKEQLGCINVQGDEDNTIRTFQTVWGEEDSLQFESFDLKLARWMDSSSVAYLNSFSEREFVIDYAAGIGETRRSADGGGERIFPVMPLAAIFETLMSGDTAAIEFLRSQFADKGVLVGYGDIGNTQVTRIVDRFYTPLKEDDKNTLPDMHGVAIHANIVNTILQQHIVQVMPLWINLIWGTLIVLVMFLGREILHAVVANPSQRTALSNIGFALLFILGALLPVLAFRFTPWKFSIYTPLAGLLLGVPTLEALDKLSGTVRDIRRRRRLRAPIPPAMRASMREILKAWNVEMRMERASHFLQLHFHSLCALLFDEAARTGLFRFDPAIVASPSPGRMLAAIRENPGALAACSPRARQAADLLAALDAEPLLRRTLRFSRSLYIALNEIRRQSQGALAESIEGSKEQMEFKESVGKYADLALKALSGEGGEELGDEFDALYAALERYITRAGAVLRREDGTVADLLSPGESLPPYIFPCRCQLHLAEEMFIYFGEQEDANNRDDFFDLVYIARTIRCQPESHPGLAKFREQAGEAQDKLM